VISDVMKRVVLPRFAHMLARYMLWHGFRLSVRPSVCYKPVFYQKTAERTIALLTQRDKTREVSGFLTPRILMKIQRCHQQARR